MRSEKEKSAHEAYKKFLDIMLYDVPLKQLDDLVVNDVTGYGTTLDEKILEIERLRKLVIDQREQGAGYEMNFVINPVHRRINPDNGLAVFIDEIEISMNINGDKNIIPLRFSSVLELTNGSWKVVHLHGSVAVNTEGDTWHKEEHLRKIEELEKLVSEKTEDLLTKNRELEIEASLERVRTVAMGMNKSDDLLNICEVTFKEFKKIGFDNLRNAIIHILNDEKGFFLDYDYSDYLGGSINHINYNSHPVVEDYLRQIKRADDAFAQVVIEGTELDGWKEFRRSGGQVDDPKLDGIQSLYYYLFSIGIGDIGISTFNPIDDTQIKILKRFGNVFDLAYRRYNDIALAEVQAREAQIELALERVRARTMAMQS
ncbi:MAG TPA: nuclear transport factor 2 family protein, partial [Ignavibacteriaceae bacterium]|nr:nuclear transport factor 2 family protein [Ignavibacteriaceae bacterium]